MRDKSVYELLSLEQVLENCSEDDIVWTLQLRDRATDNPLFHVYIEKNPEFLQRILSSLSETNKEKVVKIRNKNNQFLTASDHWTNTFQPVVAESLGEEQYLNFINFTLYVDFDIDALIAALPQPELFKTLVLAIPEQVRMMVLCAMNEKSVITTALASRTTVPIQSIKVILDALPPEQRKSLIVDHHMIAKVAKYGITDLIAILECLNEVDRIEVLEQSNYVIQTMPAQNSRQDDFIIVEEDACLPVVLIDYLENVDNLSRFLSVFPEDQRCSAIRLAKTRYVLSDTGLKFFKCHVDISLLLDNICELISHRELVDAFSLLIPQRFLFLFKDITPLVSAHGQLDSKQKLLINMTIHLSVLEHKADLLRETQCSEKAEVLTRLIEQLRQDCFDFNRGAIDEDVFKQNIIGKIEKTKAQKEITQHRSIIEILANITLCVLSGVVFYAAFCAYKGTFFKIKTDTVDKLEEMEACCDDEWCKYPIEAL